MQKTKGKILTALLLTAMTLTLFPLASASLGNILIESTGPIQPLPITPVPAGANISLNFGQVTFSGSQFYLLFSQDGLSQVTTGDIRYTPLFAVASVMDPLIAPIVLSDPNFPGKWVVGQGWVNGTIPTNIPGGNFYIKAFDGATTALAVSQAIPVIGSLKVIPDAGSAGTQIIVSGNAFPANAYVNLSYVNPVTLAIVRFINLTQANALGQFNYTMNAPDLMQAPAAGDSAPVTNAITFNAIENATAATYTASYTEAQRGLLQFGRPDPPGPTAGSIQNATGVYGNLTRFDLAPTVGITTVSVGVGNILRIAGNSFYPGAMTLKWDNSVDVTPAGLEANGTGFFNTTITVPTTGLGSHNVTIVDNGLVVFAVYVNVVQSITISPTSGPIGTLVTVSGYGFPSQGQPAGNVYNVTMTFGTSTKVLNWTLTGANGQFVTTFVVPTAPGGANTVTATANDTEPSTIATATFTVQSAFTVSPTSFYANSSAAVAASGTGFDPATRYFVAIDNVFSPFTNTTNGIAPSDKGELKFTFIGAGFQPGLHVVALYLVGSGSGSNAPVANATFTVLGETGAVLTAINNTVTQISTNLGLMNATLVALNGNLATLMTSVGTMSVDIATIKPQIATISNGMATITSSVGTITTSLSSIDGKLTSVSGTVGTINSGVATIQTSVGTITSSLNSIGTTVNSIKDGVATIQTDLGTLQGTVTATDGKVATIQTGIGTLTADVADVQTSVDAVPGAVNLPIWIAVILALVAAIASILCLVLMRRKIAG